MLSKKIKYNIENSTLLKPAIIQVENKMEWSEFTRTIFMNIAKIINKKVTQDVISSPQLVEENLLIGANELDRIFRVNNLSTVASFINYLKEIPKYRTYNWISGKTLQSYWNNANAKDKKLNVLLTFLNVNYNEWDKWKNAVELEPSVRAESSHTAINEQTNYLLKKYYLGYYYRYYQKANNSDYVIKTPFILIEDKNGNVIAQTKTVGHHYKSSSIQISGGALYIDLKNIDWEEREHHIFNIGIATAPKVLIGVSNSLNIRKQAIAKRNVLIRQDEPFDFDLVKDIEIPYENSLNTQCDDAIATNFFKQRKSNLIITSLYYNMDELQTLNHNPL